MNSVATVVIDPNFQKSLLVLVSLLICRESGAAFFNHKQSVLKKNQKETRAENFTIAFVFPSHLRLPAFATGFDTFIVLVARACCH